MNLVEEKVTVAEPTEDETASKSEPKICKNCHYHDVSGEDLPRCPACHFRHDSRMVHKAPEGKSPENKAPDGPGDGSASPEEAKTDPDVASPDVPSPEPPVTEKEQVVPETAAGQAVTEAQEDKAEPVPAQEDKAEDGKAVKEQA